MKKFYMLPLFGLLCLGTLHAQVVPFNLDAYWNFIDEHEDIPPSALDQLYPSDLFMNAVEPFSLEHVLYLDSADIHYNFTDDEISLLMKNGFLVTERISRELTGGSGWHEYNLNTFFAQLDQVFKRDLPVFISTDAILHAVHLSYDLILKSVEREILIPQLLNLLSHSHAKIASLYANYGSN